MRPRNKKPVDKWAHVPKTLLEAIAELDATLSEEEKSLVRDAKDTSEFHFSAGLDMRSAWGLWKRSPLAVYFVSRGCLHPDDMSGLILDAFQMHLRGEPIVEPPIHPGWAELVAAPKAWPVKGPRKRVLKRDRVDPPEGE